MSALLWISGDPGCGKTTLAAFLIDSLAQQLSSANNNAAVIYFFFDGNIATQGDGSALLFALIHQLLKVNPAGLPPQAEKHLTLTNPQSGLSLHSLCEIFRAIVSSPDRKPCRIACVIDALDECETTSMAKTITLLSSLISPSNITTTTSPPNNTSWFKLALTSRHTHPIADLFRALHPTHLLPLANHTPHTTRDISTFIRFRCLRVQATTGCSDSVRRAVEKRLAARSGTTFLWIHLVLDLLERSTEATPAAFDATLGTVPDRLDGLYERILQRSAAPEALLRVLGVLAASRRALTLEEVDLALAVRAGDGEAWQVQGRRQFDVARRLYAVCGPLIRVVNGVVGFVHQTAVEFLMRAPGEEVPRPLGLGGEYRYKGCLDVVGINRCLAEICVVYLILSDSAGAEDDLTTMGRGGLIVLAGYYVCFWQHPSPISHQGRYSLLAITRYRLPSTPGLAPTKVPAAPTLVRDARPALRAQQVQLLALRLGFKEKGECNMIE